MWFTENPWPPIGLCALVFAVFFIRWQLVRKRSCLYVMAACVASAVVIFFVERAIVTERERIEQSIRDLAWTFEMESALYDTRSTPPADLSRVKTLSFISSQAPELQMVAWQALKLVRVVEPVRITDVKVTLLAQGSRAKTRFRANGTVELPDGSRYYKPTYWEVTWQLEKKPRPQWKIIEVVRLNIINGQPYDSIFHAE